MVCGVEEGRRTEDSEASIMAMRRPVKGREGECKTRGGVDCVRESEREREREREMAELGSSAS
jgi:hypothetical protein